MRRLAAGDPDRWHRRVWQLAWPIIVSNLSVPLVGAVDTAVVGRLPDPVYIGAVAVGAIIFNFIYWGFGFLRMGTTGFVAQAFGAGDRRELGATTARGAALALVLGLALLAAQGPILWLALEAMQGSPRVESLASRYFEIRIWSAPAALLNYVVLGLLIGVQNTRAALALLLLLNLSNVALDLLFVVGLELGVAGVAAATLVSEYLAACAGLWTAHRNLARLGTGLRQAGTWRTSRMRALVATNFNIFVRTLGVIVAFFWFTAVSARSGDLTLAANTVLLHFTHFMAFGLDGFAHAAEALVGSAFGNRDRRALVAAVRSAAMWAGAVAALYALTYALAGGLIIDLLTGIDTVREAARRFLPWIVLAPLIGVWSYLLDGVFIGTLHTIEMRNGMLVALAAYLASIPLLTAPYGNHGLWAALLVFLAARALTLGAWLPRVVRAAGGR